MFEILKKLDILGFARKNVILIFTYLTFLIFLLNT